MPILRPRRLVPVSVAQDAIVSQEVQHDDLVTEEHAVMLTVCLFDRLLHPFFWSNAQKSGCESRLNAEDFVLEW